MREQPKHRDQRGQKRAEPQDSHVADQIGMLPPQRQGDKRGKRSANLERHVGHVAQLQVAQHEDGEKGSGQKCSECQAAAENHEFEKIAFAEAPQEHHKSKVAGRILFMRRLIHPAEEISGDIAGRRSTRKDNPETGAVRNLLKKIQQQSRRDNAADGHRAHSPATPAEIFSALFRRHVIAHQAAPGRSSQAATYGREN